MAKRKTSYITKGEKLLIFICCFCFMSSFIIKVFGSAKVGDLGINIEKLEVQISTQSKKNESLVMQVNELTSFERISSIVKNQNLAYNNNNIVVVDE